MTFQAILLLALLGAPVAAVAAWFARRLDLGWNARQRVFNSAAIAPTFVAMGAVAFATVALTLSEGQRFVFTEVFLLQAITAVLASFASGMIAAFMVERAGD